MTSYSYYTDKVAKGSIAHDDDEAYDRIIDFPYRILFNIDVTDSNDFDGKVYLIITDKPNKVFLWFFSEFGRFIEMRRAFAYNLTPQEMHNETS